MNLAQLILDSWPSRTIDRYSQAWSDYDLRLDDDLPTVDRYEFNEAVHPRFAAGSPNSVGGEFRPTGMSGGGGSGVGGAASSGMSSRFNAGSQSQASQAQASQPQQPQQPQQPRTSKKRELADRPDIQQGHKLHLGQLPDELKAKVFDWDYRMGQLLAPMYYAQSQVSPDKQEEALEQSWARVDKNQVRSMLAEMNKMDFDARSQEIQLADFVNANGVIPKMLGERLDGGARFFDPEKLRGKLGGGPQSNEPSPSTQKWLDSQSNPAAQAPSPEAAAITKQFSEASRTARSKMLSNPSMREAIESAMGIKKNPNASPVAQPLQEEPKPANPTKESPSEPTKPTRSLKHLPEANRALRALGYKPSDAGALLRKVLAAGTPFSNADELVTAAMSSSAGSQSARASDDGLTSAGTNKLESAIANAVGGDDLDKKNYFKQVALDAWKQIKADAEDHNDALRQIAGHFGKSLGTLASNLTQGVDTAKIKGFDQLIDHAVREYPQIVSRLMGESSSGGPEDALADAISEGIRPVPQPWDDEVIDRAAGLVGPGFFEDSPADQQTAASDEPWDGVPFSVRSDIVHWVQRYWYLEDIERYCQVEAIVERYSWNASEHPRDQRGRFSEVGDSFITKAYGLKDQMNIAIKSINNDRAQVSNGFMSANVPTDSLEQLYSDTTGDYSYLKAFGESKSPEVNAIINGQAKFLGKGADGVVHDVGSGMVVKSSTTVPYHTVGGGDHLSPNDAVDAFAKKINTEKAMHAAGIPGVMKTRNGIHGDKIFSIRPKVDVNQPLSDEQVKQVEGSIKAMHAAGYSINDQVQVGVADDGNVYHFDLGQASDVASEHEKNADWGHFRTFVADNVARRNANRYSQIRAWVERYAQLQFNWDEAAHPRAPKGSTEQHGGEFVKAKRELKPGYVEQPRAKAGGEVSSVDGKFYKGGALMPVHGLFSGMEKPVSKPKKADGESLAVKADQDKGPRQVRERSKEEIQADRERMENQRKWDELRSGPVGDLFWTGDRIGKFGYDVKKKMVPYLQSLSNSQVEAIGNWTKGQYVEHEMKGNRPDGMTDGEARKFIEDDFDSQAEYTSRMFLTKKLQKQLPSIATAVEGLRAITELPNPVPRLQELQSLLSVKEKYSCRSHPMHAAKPTEAQKEAGNFRMAHINVHGLDISIETPKGRARREGWPKMKAHYGYFKNTRGRDGDHVDVFVGPDRSSEMVYVIDQSSLGGNFDEHKCLIGFTSREAAIAAYRDSYKIGWIVGKVTPMTIDQFKAWLKGGNQNKPIAGQVSRYSKTAIAT